MQHHELLSSLSIQNNNKIVLLVMDGLGGVSHPNYEFKTELEYAKHPNLDKLAAEGATGQLIPIIPGVTPGSGPGHLGLFGLDPVEFNIGRGVLEALGIGVHPAASDVLARGNFCTVDKEGVITDRRAGRIATEICEQRLALLRDIKVPGVEIKLYPVKDHRFVLQLSGAGLNGDIDNTDPGMVGQKPRAAKAFHAQAEAAAKAVNAFQEQALDRLKHLDKANGLVLRGFSMLPEIPSLEKLYGLRSAALAIYPMYKGLARTVGMDVLDCGKDIAGQMETLKKVWNDYDFFFVHYKYTDSTGEDGDFAAKYKHIETVDEYIPKILELGPAAFAVTGDHSTPALLSGHSWHPIPLVVSSPNGRRDAQKTFTEMACAQGGLGTFESKYLMGLLLGHALKLEKFGA